MKKMIAILLCGLVAVSFAGCGADETETAVSASAEAEAAGEEIVISSADDYIDFVQEYIDRIISATSDLIDLGNYEGNEQFDGTNADESLASALSSLEENEGVTMDDISADASYLDEKYEIIENDAKGGDCSDWQGYAEDMYDSYKLVYDAVITNLGDYSSELDFVSAYVEALNTCNDAETAYNDFTGD